MRDCLFRKGLVIGIIILFVGAGSVPVVGNSIEIKITSKDPIEKGVSYLVSTQGDSYGEKGEFALFQSLHRDMSDEVYKKSNFATPFVYHSLGFLENLPLNSSTLNEIKYRLTAI